MSTEVAIIIPLYKSALSPLEELSVKQCFKLLSNYKIIAIKPKSLNLEHYDFNFDEVISFENHHFKNPAGYNALMLSAYFYETFLEFKYILIYQTDAFVFKDELSYWCKKNYDYIGAPWITHTDYPDVVKKTKQIFLRFINTYFNLKQEGTDLPTQIQLENRVGNGGLSLRNVKKFHQICIEESKLIEYYNSRPEHYFGEDVFWSIEVNRTSKRLQIPDHRIAIYFSMESNLNFSFKLTNGELPFGCHAWDRNLEEWRPKFTKIGIEI